MHIATTGAIHVRNIARTLTALGLDSHTLLQAVGLSPAVLADPDARVPSFVTARLLETAERLLRDESVGLRVAEHADERQADVVGYALRSCATLGEAFERLERYHRLINEELAFKMTASGGLARLTLEAPGNPPTRTRGPEQLVLGVLVVVGRRITGLNWAPRQVEFQHARPGDCSAYEHLFRAPLQFGGARSRLVLDAALLQVHLPHADDGLLNVLDRFARELVGRLPAGPGAGDQVRFLLSKELAGGDVGKDVIARQLRMSARTMQRALAAEGSSFREVLDALRRDLALRYVEERDMALAEVSYLLGFSDVSVLHRAFKRWTGRTPAAYRHAQGAAEPGQGGESRPGRRQHDGTDD